MKNILLSRSEQGIVVFKIWPSLVYSKRILLSSTIIISGLILQILFYNLFAGILFIAAGSFLLLVKGYDNRVKIGKYNPSSEWAKTDKNKFSELKQLDKKMKAWDRSIIDISNPLGLFTLILLLAFTIVPLYIGFTFYNKSLIIISVDAIVLLLPHWLTGIREILRTPKLLIKINLITELLLRFEEKTSSHNIEYYMLLKGKETKIPDNVKFRVTIEGQHPDFLGFYGQVVINTVQGHDYPYFYVVLVAKKGYGLIDYYKNYNPPANITTEYSTEKDVEVFVIRQKTSKTTGYHTKAHQVENIFSDGLSLAEKAAPKQEV